MMENPSFKIKGNNRAPDFFGVLKEHDGEMWGRRQDGERGLILASFFVEPSTLTTETEKQAIEKTFAQAPSEIGKKGLLIDDEVYLIDVLSNFLKIEGYSTETVSDGKFALERLDRVCYDFILCDIKIPGIDGMALYRELKERRSPNLNKIIFITGDIVSLKIQEFLKSVKNPFLFKPFDLKDVKEIVQQLIVNPSTR